MASIGVPLKKNAVISVSSTGLGGVNAHCILEYPLRLLSAPLISSLMVGPSTPDSTKVLPSPLKTSSLSPIGILSPGDIASCAFQILR